MIRIAPQNPVAYFNQLESILSEFPMSDLDVCINLIYEAYQNDRTIFVVGNGGSAATASHFAADLNKNIVSTGRRPRVIALTDNVASITAWGNDTDYTNVFLEQLHNFYQPGDTLVVISGSGRSPNILAVAQWVRQHEGIVIGLTGPDGSSLEKISEASVVVPSTLMEQIEDFHVVCMHAMVVELRRRCSSGQVIRK